MNTEPIRPPVTPTATKYKLNPNWDKRNNGKKPKEKK